MKCAKLLSVTQNASKVHDESAVRLTTAPAEKILSRMRAIATLGLGIFLACRLANCRRSAAIRSWAGAVTARTRFFAAKAAASSPQVTAIADRSTTGTMSVRRPSTNPI
jgi:hypothetical protein